MVKPLLPSLSEDGWVYRGYKLLDRVMSNYLAADKSQGLTIEYEAIRSFQHTIARNANDIDQTVADVHNDLTNLLSPIFTDVQIEVVDETAANQDSRAAISIFVEVTDPYGEVLNLHRLFNIEGSNFVEMTRVTNSEQS